MSTSDFWLVYDVLLKKNAIFTKIEKKVKF